MLIIILVIVIALVAWALHLMQEAVTRQEFSLMLAGTLVSFSAAALMGVYFLVGNCVGYLTNMPRIPAEIEAPYDPVTWYFVPEVPEPQQQVSLSESSIKTLIP
jgi:hypothetical protein